MNIDRESGRRPWAGGGGTLVLLGIVVLAGLQVSCVSVRNPPGTVAVRFVQNPDRVWDGIEVTLDALGYQVTSSNRDEGVIRAASSVDDPSTPIALEINQVVYTDDQVDVFVRGVAADSAAAPNQEALDGAAHDFVTVLRRKLGN